jgi:hypothetical protein
VVVVVVVIVIVIVIVIVVVVVVGVEATVARGQQCCGEDAREQVGQQRAMTAGVGACMRWGFSWWVARRADALRLITQVHAQSTADPGESAVPRPVPGAGDAP